MTNSWEPNFNKSVLKKLIERVGHNLSSSIADLVDNALDCDASEFHYGTFFNYENSFFYFYNNGKGMDVEQLKDALDVGSSEVSRNKKSTTHGLFGVGMNISALRNCDSYKVHSYDSNGNCHSFRQYIDRHDKIMNDDNAEIPENLNKLFDFKNKKRGTLIIWEKLKSDRFDMTEYTSFNRELIDVQIHLMITFNKIIKNNSFKIYFLNEQLEYLDPMMSNHLNTTKIPTKIIKVDNDTIEISSFIVPEEDSYDLKNSKLLKFIPKRSDLEGLYFYRNQRAIHFAGWNNLIAQSRLRKLHRFYERIRIEINFTEKSDHLFEINPTKRGILSFPEFLKIDLLTIIENLRNRLSLKAPKKNKVQSIFTKDGYWKMLNEKPIINFDNKEISDFIFKFPGSEDLLKKISKNIPILFTSNLDKEDIKNSEKSVIEFGVDLINNLLDNFTLEQAFDLISSRKPFVKDKELTQKLKEAING